MSGGHGGTAKLRAPTTFWVHKAASTNLRMMSLKLGHQMPKPTWLPPLKQYKGVITEFLSAAGSLRIVPTPYCPKARTILEINRLSRSQKRGADLPMRGPPLFKLINNVNESAILAVISRGLRHFISTAQSVASHSYVRVISSISFYPHLSIN